jgi:hypothetical protein
MDGRVVYCVESPRGNPSNRHFAIDPVWGEVIGARVTKEAATMAIIHDAGGCRVVHL